MTAAVPITVLGGYLGAGKTTLLNRLLHEPGGRRLGVIVNDFGSLGIDADLLSSAPGDGLVSLPNGCVCCTLGTDLYDALRTMAGSATPPDHIVVEASGVADPAVAAAWGTSDGFAPGGVVVLAAADAVRRQARDRYVGDEVRRQVAGADLLVVTRSDLCGRAELDAVEQWLDETSSAAPRVRAVHGDVPVDVVLGVRPDAVPAPSADDHTGRYVSWSFVGGAIGAAALHALLDDLPRGLLRLKGVVELVDGSHRDVQVVGRTAHAGTAPTLPIVGDAVPRATGTRLVAIGVRGLLDVEALERRLAAR